MINETINSPKNEISIGTADGPAAGVRYVEFVKALQAKYPNWNFNSDELIADRVYLLKLDDEIAGVLVGFRDRRYKKAFVGQRLITDPGFAARKLDLGRQLMDAAKEDFDDIFIFAQPFALLKDTNEARKMQKELDLADYYASMDFKVVDPEKGGMAWHKPGAEL